MNETIFIASEAVNALGKVMRSPFDVHAHPLILQGADISTDPPRMNFPRR
jgi:hypothetical protein